MTRPTAPDGFRHATIAAAGVDFHCVMGGVGRPLVLLLAGFPQTCHAWRRVLPLIAPYVRVVAVDLPGQGDSAVPVDGYDTATAAARVAALLDALQDGGEGPAFVVGHDIGAWVAYPFAAQYPARIAGAVLIDGNIPGVTLPDEAPLGPDGWRSWHFSFNAIPGLPEALLAGRERMLIEWFFAQKALRPAETFAAADIDEYARCYSRPDGLSGMLGYYRAVDIDRAQNRRLSVKQVSVPLLALGGAEGSAPDLFEKMCPLGRDVRGGIIADSGHYVPEEQPSAVAEAVLGFVGDLA